MFPKSPASLGESEVLGIVTGQSKTIARLETRGRGSQRAPHGVCKSSLVGRRRRDVFYWRSTRLIVSWQRLETPAPAKTIDVTLREHRAKPGPEGAAAVKVAEKRSTLAFALGQSEQLGVKAVRGFACRAGPIDRVRSSIEDGAVLANEVFPGRIIPIRAGGCQGQVFEMKGG